MSRGPGKWQRLILQAVAERGEVRLLDLMPPPDRPMTRGEFIDDRCWKQQAIERAARKLARKGLILMGRVRSPRSRPYHPKWDISARPVMCLYPRKDT